MVLLDYTLINYLRGRSKCAITCNIKLTQLDHMTGGAFIGGGHMTIFEKYDWKRTNAMFKCDWH